jgi:hypothetical protein
MQQQDAKLTVICAVTCGYFRAGACLQIVAVLAQIVLETKSLGSVSSKEPVKCPTTFADSDNGLSVAEHREAMKLEDIGAVNVFITWITL